jgi:hypothetical protein
LRRRNKIKNNNKNKTNNKKEMIEADLGGFSGALTIRPTDFGGQSVDG